MDARVGKASKLSLGGIVVIQLWWLLQVLGMERAVIGKILDILWEKQGGMGWYQVCN